MVPYRCGPDLVNAWLTEAAAEEPDSGDMPDVPRCKIHDGVAFVDWIGPAEVR